MTALFRGGVSGEFFADFGQTCGSGGASARTGGAFSDALGPSGTSSAVGSTGRGLREGGPQQEDFAILAQG